VKSIMATLFDELLLLEIQKHENLYNPGLMSYRDRYYTERSWMSISKELNTPGTYKS